MNALDLFDLREARRDGFLLRRLAIDDLPEVLRIELGAFQNPWSEELIRRELENEWSTILVACDSSLPGSPIAGFVIFWAVHDEIHVLNVAVDPTRRRRGVARALLGEMLSRARERGASLATLEVRTGNGPALGLYESLGFRRIGVRPRYYADNDEDAVVMVLPLTGEPG